MGKLSRAHRIALQDEDTGDPSDPVYLKPRGSGRTPPTTYHDRRDCYRLHRYESDDPPDELTRAEAQARWKAPCRTCVVD